MKANSILNDVLGPVMRGPSSSHTAASYHIGALARSLLGEAAAKARFVFNSDGSWAEVYRQQGSDLGFAAGLMGWAITDDRFLHALDVAAAHGLAIQFAAEPLPHADHPNVVEIEMTSVGGRSLSLVAKSIGGGAVLVTRLADWPVHLSGDAHEVLVELDRQAQPTVLELLGQSGNELQAPQTQARGSKVLLHLRYSTPLAPEIKVQLETMPDVLELWTAAPVFFSQEGRPLFASAVEMVSQAEARDCSLGQMALEYESSLLGIASSDVMAEVHRRFEVMREAVHRGLGTDLAPMQLLRPSAEQIYRSEAAGLLAAGGLHTRAAARALAVMHVNGGMGVVCAAPTAGSAGTIPAVAVTLAEEMGLGSDEIARALLAAGAVGLIVANRATFAAEVAGCQVEIGASGAMAAAAVVEAEGGPARQAADAAAIAFQNTMGSVCDLVQGIVEIPCHTRNAVAASSAFVCADLVLGGYTNPIPLDETIDAVYAVGKMLPRELKVTALGGLAQTPSALAMPRLRAEPD
ncbi:MAG: L-serine ammonia-lyase, iron-sulfur-dependent, subunit alpha [Anaerolineae bacterium]|jgi:L-serine dehydratase